MPQSEESPKLFTVEEANQLLPQVGRILKQLRRYRDTIQRLDEQKAVEELSWLREDGTVSPQAQSQITRLQKEMDEAVHAFELELEGLNRLGAQLKDLEEGLVDFFTAREDSLVYLCWKEGEDRIRHWHDLESGFPGRRPLTDL